MNIRTPPILAVVLSLLTCPAFADTLADYLLDRFPGQVQSHPQAVVVCICKEWAGGVSRWDTEDAVLLQTGCWGDYSPEFEAAAKAGAAGGIHPMLDPNALPDIQDDHFKVTPYLKVATRLRLMGGDAAHRVLAQAAKAHPDGRQVIVLCRMLFKKKNGADFRRPKLGDAQFLGGTDYGDWPLEPIALVDGMPFLIVRGYMLAGHAEEAEYYLRYCEQNCDWSDVRYRYRADDEKEKAAALDKLLASPKWKRPLNNEERQWLSGQIK